VANVAAQANGQPYRTVHTLKLSSFGFQFHRKVALSMATLKAAKLPTIDNDQASATTVGPVRAVSIIAAA
jgi:hypothetical protein